MARREPPPWPRAGEGRGDHVRTVLSAEAETNRFPFSPAAAKANTGPACSANNCSTAPEARLKMRLVLLASMVSRLDPGPVIWTSSVMAISPLLSVMVLAVLKNPESNVITLRKA